jgi:flavin-binding protein dodecin
MSNHVYGISEIVGAITSTESIDDAIQAGLERAAKTFRDLDWFQVSEVRGHVVDGGIGHLQLTMKLGFRIEDTATSNE